ncbi:MAG: class I SAM-dependent methyltransferase [Anaerolineales bacterium]|nr:class I SAM-dependent methyltransferase [Anaerolineales bacterium]
MVWLIVALALVFVGALLYWQLIIAEGAYLGKRVVVLLYDWSAHLYERIKQYDVGDEQWFLGLPLGRALEEVPAPLVLDVATGIGRLPRALLRQPAFDGRVIGLDLSRRMLDQAVQTTAPFADRVTFLWQDAQSLPFRSDTFDAVTCLEALEFMPRPEAVLAELVRVLRPGGVLLTTNRIGRQARLLPGRTFSRDELEAILTSLPLESVQIRPWQVEYQLIWAVKIGRPVGGGVHPLSEIMRCPTCHSNLERATDAFCCTGCARRYPIAADGVIEMAR